MMDEQNAAAVDDDDYVTLLATTPNSAVGLAVGLAVGPALLADVVETSRLAALRALDILDTPDEAVFDDLTFLAAQVCGTPMALISLVDEQRQWFKSRLGLDVCSTSREGSFCAHALQQADVLEVFIVADAQLDPRFVDNALVTGHPFIRSYAGALLVTGDGHCVGTLCVLDTVPREFSGAQIQQLSALGRQVMAQLGLRRQTGLLAAEVIAREAFQAELARSQEMLRISAESALRVSEHRFQQIAGSIRIGFSLRATAAGGLLYFNPAWTDIFGFVPASDRDGEAQLAGLVSRVHRDDRTEVVSKLSRAIGDWDRLDTEFRYFHPHRGRRWVHTAIFPVQDADGDLTQVVTVSEDITARKDIEAALRVSSADADAANTAKSQFLSRTSHELRTPLNAVLGFAQLLELDPLTDEQLDSVSQILLGGWHLLAMIDDLLDIARIENNLFRPHLAPTPIASVITDVLGLCRPLAAAAGVSIELGTDADSRPHHVLADSRKLTQVLLNLVSNAIKYNRPRGSITITTTASTHRLEVAVTDTGTGIRAQDLTRLFDPFDRLGHDTSAIEGTGIGLTVTRALLLEMNGTIDVTSTYGTGSTFTITLPVAPLVAPVNSSTS